MNPLPPEIAPLRRRLAHFLEIEEEAIVLNDLEGAAEAPAAIFVEPDVELSTDEAAERSIATLVDDLREAGLPVAWFGHGRDSDTGYHRSTSIALVGPEQLADKCRTGIEGFALAGTDFAADGDITKRVAIVSSEFHGPMHNGGIGTSYTALAEALTEDGHDVTVVYLGDHLSEEPMEHWVGHYEGKGIRFVPIGLEQPRRIRWQYEWPRRAWLAMHWLLEQDGDDSTRFDVIHFPECNGHGFYVVEARKAGLGFADTVLCTGAHSSTRWIFEAAGNAFYSMSQLALDFMEQQCLEGCDVVVSPSAYLVQWMKNTGWQLPAATFAQQNVQPHTARGGVDEPLEEPLPDATPIKELVFFGRLETRKGIHTFCDALDLLAERDAMKEISVTFMGKITDLEGTQSDAYLEKRSKRWSFDYQILGNLDQTGANQYLAGEGRLAVMPSPVDNSPNTVLECIGLKIPFLASQAGGIPELIDPRDVAVCTFHHPIFERRHEAMADKLEAILGSGSRPARRAVSSSGNEQAWCDWHRQIEGPAPFRRRQKPGTPIHRDQVEVLPIGNEPETDRPFLLVVEPEMELEEPRLKTWLEAAGHVDKDVVTGFHHAPAGQEEPAAYPVGPAAVLAVFVNAFGPGPFLVRRRTLKRLLLPERSDVSLSDLRNFFLESMQSCVSFGFVPLALCDYPFPEDPRARTGEEPPMEEDLADLLLADASPAVKFLFRFAGAKQERADAILQEYYDLKYRVKEGYEKLEAAFEEQTAWLEDRVALLKKTEAELEKVRKESSKRAEAVEKAKARVAKVEAERDELKSNLESRRGGLLKRLLGK